VRSTDSLSSIAQMFGVTVNTIIWANDIKGGVIHEGESLIILPISGIKHSVLKGETLATLATTYKSNVHDIASYNNLADDAALTVGQSVIIPNGEVVPPAPVKKPLSKIAIKIRNIASGKSTEPFLGGSGPAIDGYFAWPVDGGVVTQGIHGWNGVDIGAPKGTSIFAAAEGTVIIAKGGGSWNGGYGNYVVIQHPNGTQTLYAHASKLLVSVGDSVSQGQTIAKIGATGMATGPHLHVEVHGAANPFANF
jgi:murein DD-endopeptidase MepM/ murein hydrolase activator NlpD